ncbi:MAG: hypothetical protein GY805_01190 [Chloroflexi bacterium]|nr:hypothetical protein [Chloroflexota bacterium]
MEPYEFEEHLIVFHDKSELVYETGDKETFKEGKLSKESQERLVAVRTAFADGFLQNIIDECRSPIGIYPDLAQEHIDLLSKLVDSVTSEVGRAVVGLAIMQLCIKSIVPAQNVRLHKGGNSYGSTRFSWEEGIPMRSLDKSFVTPVLRSNDLLRVNADGFMMTRSLAENYPYSRLYKAAIRGARNEWIEIVDLLETGELEPANALRMVIRLLLNRSNSFAKSADATLAIISQVVSTEPSVKQVVDFFSTYIGNATYSARLLEVAMHSLYQALEDRQFLEGDLKQLSQMRSANKKHGNVADVELTIPGTQFEILEAWDAKYGKPYLRDELEELNEKLREHSETNVAGFVIDKEPHLTVDIVARIEELQSIHDVDIFLLSFNDWAEQTLSQAGVEQDKTALEWLSAFTESICQRRRDRAPIDEPSDEWVQSLRAIANEFFGIGKGNVT